MQRLLFLLLFIVSNVVCDDGKLVSGFPVTRAGVDYVVYLQASTFPREFMCPAALISMWSVVTAGTCVSVWDEMDPNIKYKLWLEDFVVQLGSRWIIEDYDEMKYEVNNPNERNLYQFMEAPKRIIVHDHYKYHLIHRMFTHNIAVVVMKNFVTRTPGVNYPITIMYYNEQKLDEEWTKLVVQSHDKLTGGLKEKGAECIVAGWGQYRTKWREIAIPEDLPALSRNIRVIFTAPISNDKCTKVLCDLGDDIGQWCPKALSLDPTLKMDNLSLHCLFPLYESFEPALDHVKHYPSTCRGDRGDAVVCEGHLWGIVNWEYDCGYETRSPILITRAEALAFLYDKYAFDGGGAAVDPIHRPRPEIDRSKSKQPNLIPSPTTIHIAFSFLTYSLYKVVC